MVHSALLEPATRPAAHGRSPVERLQAKMCRIYNIYFTESSLVLVSKVSDGASPFCGPRLTAFVLRCFLQAQRYMQVDQSVLTRALTWLLKHQGPQGEFSEVGRLISTEMQGGLDGGSVGLTAYVLMALLEDDSYVVSRGNLC